MLVGRRLLQRDRVVVVLVKHLKYLLQSLITLRREDQPIEAKGAVVDERFAFSLDLYLHIVLNNVLGRERRRCICVV
jgi:hypothetical protein